MSRDSAARLLQSYSDDSQAYSSVSPDDGLPALTLPKLAKSDAVALMDAPVEVEPRIRQFGLADRFGTTAVEEQPRAAEGDLAYVTAEPYQQVSGLERSELHADTPFNSATLAPDTNPIEIEIEATATHLSFDPGAPFEFQAPRYSEPTDADAHSLPPLAAPSTRGIAQAQRQSDAEAPQGDAAYQVITTPPPTPVFTITATLGNEDRAFNPSDRFTYQSGVPTGPASLAGIEVIDEVSDGATGLMTTPQPSPSAEVLQVDEFMAQGVQSDSPGATSTVSTEAADLVVDPDRALTEPILRFQAAFLFQEDELSARGRLTGIYPITSYLLVGGSVDVTEGDAFIDSELEGVNINELYVTAAPPSIPNLRFTLGQLDLTSYFDRNSFAKDAVTHFFNPIFQTNPALATSGIGSRQGILANWSITDDVRLAVSGFSSDRSISDFELDAVAAELGVRLGNAIIRGTYVNAEDAGADDGPADIFSLNRGDGEFGVEEGDREEAFGLNAEYFIPELNLGLFARFGHYTNRDADFDADTISGGINLLDVFVDRDRLGLAYGQNLRGGDGDGLDNADALELFYDFPIRRNLRAGFTLQQRDDFSETVAGFRIRSDFDILP